ncbi:MAG: hypothetical protein KDD61_15970 [Bdellovibrionales bacterium]|nr:hypothetical protein [Bdellovibrionales bacterium]
MDKMRWIKDLVLAEQQMEESGIIDMDAGFNQSETLKAETVDFLKDIKDQFIESASAFNQLKCSTVGTLKIYGISKTVADFMLFRNGHKLIFSMKQPGLIQIYKNQIGSQFAAGTPVSEMQTSSPQVDALVATWGAFGDLTWTFKSKPIRIDYLVRFYFSQFVKESSK